MSAVAAYSAKATQGDMAPSPTNVGFMLTLRTLTLPLTEEQAKNPNVALALAILLDEGVKIRHDDGGIVTTFHR